jgi:hypothetical protein
MKRFVFPFVLALLSTAAFAQTTHTFTFGPFPSGCAAMQTLDGQPADSCIGYTGLICVPSRPHLS